MILAAGLLVSCGSVELKNAEYDMDEIVEMEAAYAPMEEGTTRSLVAGKVMADQANADGTYRNEGEGTIPQGDKIIKTGNMGIVVDDYAKGLATIGELVKAANGYISYESEQRNKHRITNNLTIRVPSAGFDGLMQGVGELAAELKYKHVNLQDVTEEYTDVAARLKTKREVEQRYLEILKTARTVKDILEVEEKLGYIRMEIESSEARLKYLDNRVAYSTLTVEVTQELNPAAPLQAGFFTQIKKALTSGWNGLLATILTTIRLWPFILIGLAVVLGVRVLVKRRKA